MTTTPQAISDIADPDSIRVQLYASNQPVHAPLPAAVQAVLDGISSTQGSILYRGASSWAALAPGAARQFLQTQGSGANPQWANALTVAAAQTLNGNTSVTFGSIPAGVNMVAVLLNEVSEDSGDEILVRLGDSGGIETTAYSSASSTLAGTTATVNNGTAFQVTSGSLNSVTHGVLLFFRVTGNTWAMMGNMGRSNAAVSLNMAGSKILSDTLTQVQILLDGAGQFDNGEATIAYLT